MQNKTSKKPVIKVGIIDDQVVFTSGIALLLNEMPGISAVMQAHSGEHILKLLKTAQELPDILLMDVEMEGMDGIDATKEITVLYPGIKIIAITAKKDERTVILMLAAGACAYLTKQVTPTSLEMAIHEVYLKGKYHADLYHLNTGELRQFTKTVEELSFSDNEKRYIQLLCKGYEYSQIAAAMDVTIDAVSYYRRCVSQKLDTKSKILIAIEALRMGIITLDKL